MNQCQCCDEASDSVLIENNGVTPDSIIFSENSITSAIAESSCCALTLMPGVDGPQRFQEENQTERVSSSDFSLG